MVQELRKLLSYLNLNINGLKYSCHQYCTSTSNSKNLNFLGPNRLKNSTIIVIGIVNLLENELE